MSLRILVLAGFMLGHGFGLLLMPRPALAVASGVYISELQTGGVSGRTNDEFVELYNATTTAIPLAGWQLQYRSSSNGADCTKGWKSASLPANANIPAHGFFLLADRSYPVVADTTFSGLDMAATSGTIRLVAAAGTSGAMIVDALAWGDAACGSGGPATLSSNQSLERLPGAQAPLGGNGYNTNDNAKDFALRLAPEPQTSKAPAEEPLNIAEASAGDLELSEVLVRPVDDDQSSYVEFYNHGTAAAVLSVYKLKIGAVQYYLPSRLVLPGSYVAVRSADWPLSFPEAGGAIILQLPDDSELESTTYPAPPVGQAWAWTDEGWAWTTKPTLEAVNELVEPAPGLGAAVPQAAYPRLAITELLPDPAAPATDAADEFIELFNPNSFALNLSGYSLRVGGASGDDFELPDVEIDAGGYIAFTSAQSGLTLANGGAQVGVYDPAGQLIGTAIAYSGAKSGQAWASFNSGWSWTTTPTPAGINRFTAPIAKVVAAKKIKATKAKVTKPKVTKAKTTKTAKTSKPKPLLAGLAAPGGPWLLFALAGLTIGYIIYEFRYDLRNYYYRLRGYTKPGRPSGQMLKGRGGHRAS